MWSDWTSVNSEGKISDDLLPADCWQARWFCEWDVEIRDVASMYYDTVGHWKWQIEGEGYGTMFQSETKVKLCMSWMSYGWMGINENLASAVWWHDDAADALLTMIPVWVDRPTYNDPRNQATYGKPIWASGPDWHYASHPDSEDRTEQPYTNPGGGDDVMLKTYHIQTWWEGPQYNITIPAGSRWRVTEHNIGGTWLTKLANLQIRTRSGGDVGGCIDTPGVARVGAFVDGAAWQRFYPRSTGTFYDRRIELGLRSPQLLKDRQNRLYCLAQKSQVWQLLRSENDGYTWSVLRVLWPAGYSNARFCILPDGSVLSIASKGSQVFSTRDNIGTFTRVSAGNMNPPCSLVYDSRVGAMIMDSQGKRWVSKDCGQSWEAV